MKWLTNEEPVNEVADRYSGEPANEVANLKCSGTKDLAMEGFSPTQSTAPSVTLNLKLKF